MVVFILFYSDFLASIVTLKEIRKENAKFFITSTSTLSSNIEKSPSQQSVELTKGVSFTPIVNSKILLESDSPEAIKISYYYGHTLLIKTDAPKPLLIQMPDVLVTVKQGQCNLFCYDNIIRIIPLTHPISINVKGNEQEIPPGSTFFLLNNKEIIINPNGLQ